MVLRLDPRIPAVWRDPFSLQFGVGVPLTVLRDVSNADERMIAALSTGISRSGLDMIGRASGATLEQVDSLVERLAPALEPDRPEAPPTVVVAGSGPTVVQLAADLAASGLRVRLAPSPSAAAEEECALAIAVGSFVLAPEYFALWLRQDVPHLPVIIDDTAVTIGPVIEPGVGPCLHCLNRYRVDADASWPAIATQLLGRRAASESALVASEAAALTSRVTERRLRSGATSVHESISLDIATGATTTQTWLPHPECGCITLGVDAASA
jgi:bacteriocin biosynthesis cyclodehydratase domain-containing protein